MDSIGRQSKRPSSSPAPELESPSKRLKLSPSSSIPLPLSLLTHAQSLHSQAIALLPNWTEYLKLELAAISVLRTLVDAQYEGAGLVGGGRLELRGRVLLIEWLGMVYGDENRGEREKVIAKGLSFAQTHPNLAPYKYLFLLHQSLLSFSSNPKFSKSTLKRALSDLNPSSLPPHHIPWLYQLHFTLFDFTWKSGDYTGALVCLKDIEKEATKRGHEGVKDVVGILMFRIAFDKWDTKVLSSLVGEGGAELVKRMEEDEKDHKKVDKMLKVMFWLNYAVYLIKEGSSKEAKERLKLAHKLLDDGSDKAGEKDGWARVNLNATEQTGLSPSTLPSSSTLRIPTSNAFFLQLEPKPYIYCYAFLVSVAVQRDPFGTEPRALTFARAGIKEIESNLESLNRSSLLPREIHSHRILLLSQKIVIHLFRAELDLMRSQIPSCLHHLHLAISTSLADPSGALWDKYKTRITLDFGLVAFVKDQIEESENCFRVVRELCKEELEDGSGVPGEGRTEVVKEIEELAELSLILLRISQGDHIRTTDAPPSASSSASSLAPPSSSKKLRMSLPELATSLASTSTTQNSLISSIVKSLTKDEIIKSKQYLSNCLKIGNDWGGQGNHLKAIVLALLANLFLLTRNDQAQKMLQASFQIARGMGDRPAVSKSTSTQGAAAAPPGSRSKALSDDTVGNPRLGLWLGERLAESYRKTDPGRVQQQVAMNAAHKKALEDLLRV